MWVRVIAAHLEYRRPRSISAMDARSAASRLFAEFLCSSMKSQLSKLKLMSPVGWA